MATGDRTLVGVLLGVIVVLALAVGVLSWGLVRAIDDDATPDEAASGSGEDAAGAETATDDGDADAPTEPIDPDDIDPADVPLVVASADPTPGVAQSITEVLVDAGYTPGPPTTDVIGDDNVLDTVYYITDPESFEGQAQRVAQDLDLPIESVVPLPDRLPVAPEALGLAAVLVVIGTAPGGLASRVA